ncbi:MAG: DinB family protein [Acidobacteria bacterium]|nr:DinB family protein [Acidobacteriota bacterium]
MAIPEQEFDQALQFAQEVREKVLAFLEGISQTESESKSSSEAWSIGEIAHHLLLSEQRLSQQILESIASNREGEFNQEEVLAERPFSLEDTADTGKSGKGTAPEPTQPSPGLSITDLLVDLRQARDETRVKLLPLRSRPLNNLWWVHPRFGPMTLYERIRMSGYHDLKHLTQLKKVLARNADQAK